MSDWLSIIIVVLIIAIVLDGLRRARNSRRGKVRLSRNARKADKILESEKGASASSDFPGGGARKKDRTIDEDLHDRNPEQASLDLDDPVPMLMESVEQNETRSEIETPTDSHLEPTLGSLNALEEVEPLEHGFDRELIEEKPTSEIKSKLQKAADYFSRDHVAEQGDNETENLNSEPATEEILVINIMSKQGQFFYGEDILEVLTAVKLKFGEMGIFHRYAEEKGEGASIFSIANIVEPGIFDLSTIYTVETPGLCMFLPLPSAITAIDAYENLIETAREIARLLDGELKDENRSALTNQTIEHGRQRVLEFERKHKLHK